MVVDLSMEVVGAGHPFARGDLNDHGGYNVADAVFLFDNLFANGPDPSCQESADVNDDGNKDNADGIFILNGLFINGPPPQGSTTPTEIHILCELFQSAATSRWFDVIGAMPSGVFVTKWWIL